MPILNKKQKDLLNLIRKDIQEATSTGTGSGRYTIPMSPGIRLFNKKQLQPFVVPTSEYDDAMLDYDSYDGSLDVSKSEANKIETNARRISKYIKNHPSDNDEDGDILNQEPRKLMESEQKSVGELIKSIYPIIVKTAGIEKRSGNYPSIDDARRGIIKKIKNGDDDVFDNLIRKSSGMYKEQFIDDIEMLRKLTKKNLSESKLDEIKDIIETITPIIMKIVNVEKKRMMSSGDWMDDDKIQHNIVRKILSGDGEILDRLSDKATGSHMKNEIVRLKKLLNKNLNEDLAVWFGTKKKPKGSKQPKGPWVNICRKVDGKHPPCGRPEAKDKGYPKCRAAGVASKMSDSQKKAACAKKRRAEKTHSKAGTGNKPKMSSYKPRKESKIDEIVNKVLNRLNNNVL